MANSNDPDDRIRTDIEETATDAQTKTDIEVTMTDAILADAKRRQAAVPAGTPDKETFNQGSVLLNTYNVLSAPIQGGMGVVYRVHHNSWDVDLAVKRPKESYFQTEKQKENFVKECERWINLGLHPNIVSCYYVRELDGIPSVFSEWMDGGSLSDLIKSGKLYEGTEKEVQARLLDIAIQFARGLQYSHQNGLIHQDVKPGNLMLTKDSEAKVTDFGIAGGGTDESANTWSGAYTREYASAEQQSKGDFTPKTDIYSWAVSILMMYCGKRLWQNGIDAGLEFEKHVEQTRVPLPEKMTALLRSCLEQNLSDRPESFDGVLAELMEEYARQTGDAYPREEPKAASDTADSLNNRALSYLDLGRSAEAEKLWERAFLTNPNCMDAVYNMNLFAWRSGRSNDLDAIAKFQTAVANQVDANEAKRGEELMERLYVERGRKEDTPEFSFSLHTESAVAVSITADANWCVSSARARFDSDRYEIRLWDTRNGSCVKVIDGCEEDVQHIAFHSSERLVAAAYESCIRIWNAANGRLHKALGKESCEAEALLFAEDEKLLFSSHNDNTIRIWNIHRGKCIGKIEQGDDTTAYGLCMGPRAGTLLSAQPGCCILYDYETGKLLRRYDAPPNVPFKCIQLSPDGKTIAAAGSKGVYGFDIDSGECTCYDTNHNRPGELRWTRDGRYLVEAICGSDNNLIRIIDVAQRRCTYTIKLGGYTFSSTSVGLTPDGRSLLSASAFGVDRIALPPQGVNGAWELSRIISQASYDVFAREYEEKLLAAREAFARGSIREALELNESAWQVPGYENSSDCRSLNRQLGKSCKIFNIRAVTQAQSVTNPCKGGLKHLFIGSGETLLSSKPGDAGCCLWKLDDGSVLKEFAARNLRLLCVASNGKSAFADRIGSANLEVLSLETGNIRSINKGSISPIKGASCTPDGRLVMIADSSHVNVIDADAGCVLGELPGGSNAIIPTPIILPGGARGIVHYGQGNLRLFDLKNRSCLAETKLIDNIDCSGNKIYLSPDGRFLLCLGHMRTKLYSTSNLACLWTEQTSFTFAFFLPAGDCFLAARKNSGIYRIDTVTGSIAETVESRINLDVFSSANSDRTLVLAQDGMCYQFDYRYVVK